MTLRMTQLDTPTVDHFMFILTPRKLHSSYHNEIYTAWLKYQTLKISTISGSYITLFVIYKLLITPHI